MANEIYTDMVSYLTAGESVLAAGTSGIFDSATTKLHLEQFKKHGLVKDGAFEQVCNLFEYDSRSQKTEVVPKDSKLISATTYNDYYKFTMAPVIGAVEDHQSNHQMVNHITFGVDLRDPGIAKQMLEKGEYHTKLSHNLDKLKDRLFNHAILNKLKDSYLPFKAIANSYWTKSNVDKIFGENPENPKSLLGIYKSDLQRNIRDMIIQCGSIKPYNHESGEMSLEQFPITEGHFWEGTIILNGQFIPNPDCNIVVLSMYVGPDAKKTKESGEKNNLNNKKLHIEATGKWRNVSWLETSMMQTVYETAHSEDLLERKASYGQWLAEALFRTYLGMKYLETPGADAIKVALFSGRRTGGFLYNLLQNLLWNSFSVPFTPFNLKGRNLGTSSVDAWYQLNSRSLCICIGPAGTHAHEISMVLSSIYPELDKDNLVLTQVLGHYLYYKLTHQTSPAPMPMLPDTLGTESFLRAANVILSLSNDKKKNVPFLQLIGSARQDSGELPAFLERVSKYDYRLGKMASEIDKLSDFNEAQRLGYGLAGVGGCLGDTEKVWNVTGGRSFTASMAVKAVRVFLNGNLHEYSNPVKTGDGHDAAKVTGDTTLPIDKYTSIIDTANRVKNENIDKPVLKYDASLHAEKNKEFHTLAQDIISGTSLESTYMNDYEDGELSEAASRIVSGFEGGKLSLYKTKKNISKSNKKNRKSSRRHRVSRK